MNWADLFERAESHETDEETVRETLTAIREAGDDRGGRETDDEREGDDAGE